MDISKATAVFVSIKTANAFSSILELSYAVVRLSDKKIVEEAEIRTTVEYPEILAKGVNPNVVMKGLYSEKEAVTILMNATADKDIVICWNLFHLRNVLAKYGIFVQVGFDVSAKIGSPCGAKTLSELCALLGIVEVDAGTAHGDLLSIYDIYCKYGNTSKDRLKSISLKR